jgi:hypothetical protein
MKDLGVLDEYFELKNREVGTAELENEMNRWSGVFEDGTIHWIYFHERMFIECNLFDLIRDECLNREDVAKADSFRGDWTSATQRRLWNLQWNAPWELSTFDLLVISKVKVMATAIGDW